MHEQLWNSRHCGLITSKNERERGLVYFTCWRTLMWEGRWFTTIKHTWSCDYWNLLECLWCRVSPQFKESMWWIRIMKMFLFCDFECSCAITILYGEWWQPLVSLSTWTWMLIIVWESYIAPSSKKLNNLCIDSCIIEDGWGWVQCHDEIDIKYCSTFTTLALS